MKAKKTLYNGYEFRSKLEAKWAVFFDLCGIRYDYEPEAFICNDGSQYTPDFFLPDVYLRYKTNKGVYIEIKPEYFNDNEYCNRVSSSVNSLILLVGDPVYSTDMTNYPNLELAPHYDDYMILMFCDHCGLYKFDYFEGSYYYCPLCDNVLIDGGMYNSPIKANALQARKHRFEYVKLDKQP